MLLCDGTVWKQLANTMRERVDVFHINGLAPFCRTFTSPRTRFGIRQAFLFCSCESRLVDQYALPFVPLSRAAEPDHDGAELRVTTRPACQRNITSRQKHEMIEIRALKTQRPSRVHAEKAPLPELLATFGAGGVANDPRRPRSRSRTSALDQRISSPSTWTSHPLGYGALDLFLTASQTMSLPVSRF